MNKVVYPGTFDPLTYGHLDLIKRATRIFDQVVVGVAHNPFKQPLFDVQERLEMVQRSIKGIDKVRVETFEGLVVDYVKKKKARAVIRGLRMVSDFEYEFQMALTNRKLADDVEVVFMMPSESYSYISSRLIKEAAALGASLKDFVPGGIEKALKKKLKSVQKI